MIKYLIIFEKTGIGYCAYIPDLPGCVATGRTKAIVEKNIYQAIQFHLEGLKESNIAIPVNKTEAGTLFINLSSI